MEQDNEEYSGPLTSTAVNEVLLSLLYQDAPADLSAAVKVHGIVTSYGFDPAKVEAAKPRVAAMIKELDPSFHRTGGGGMSFLNLCMGKRGRQWTGMHQVQEQLCAIAIAVGLAQWCVPPEMRNLMPGGVPYGVFIDDAAMETTDAPQQSHHDQPV